MGGNCWPWVLTVCGHQQTLTLEKGLLHTFHSIFLPLNYVDYDPNPVLFMG